MDYFEQLLNEINLTISIETDKMLEISKSLEESRNKIEELKKQKQVIEGLSNKITLEY